MAISFRDPRNKDFSGQINMNIKILKTWILPALCAGLLFFAVRPVFAQIADISIPTDVEVGQEVKNGFVRIYYIHNGSKKFISQENENSKQPSSKGEYIVWVTEKNDAPGQIFMYQLGNGTITQLTYSGTNQLPKVSSEGKVVWQGWTNDTWQIFFFDGKSVKQLTNSEPSLNPDIEEDNIVFTQKEGATYKAVLYSISKQEFKDITVGIEAKHPKLAKGKIKFTQKEFPLTAEDLFLLDLSPLSATPSASPEPTVPEVVTPTDIQEELSASPSASPVETPAPESSSSGQLEGPQTLAP